MVYMVYGSIQTKWYVLKAGDVLTKVKRLTVLGGFERAGIVGAERVSGGFVREP